MMQENGSSSLQHREAAFIRGAGGNIPVPLDKVAALGD